MNGRIGLTMAAAALLATAQVAAHHGAGVFEPEKKVIVAGTVTDFQFVNPHVLIYLSVKDDGGGEVKWGGELTSPNRLARMGGAVKWHKAILKPGDSITVTGYPARNGAPMLDITKIVDAAGAVLIDE